MTETGSARETLQTALVLVDKLNEDKIHLEKCTQEKDKLEKALNTLRKNIDQEKHKTVSSRRNDVEKGFDKKIRSIEDEISKIENRRAKARTQGVKSRIETQTAGLREEIESLKAQLSAFCKEKELPFFCKMKLYYKLFCPSHLSDWLLVLCIAALMIGALVYSFYIHHMKFFFGALGADVLLIALYVFIWSSSKGKHTNEVKVCHQMIEAIRQDEKGIQNITKNIHKDKDDSQYDLGEFDAELAGRKQELQEQEAQKTSALYQFDNVTKQQLMAEIDMNYTSRLEQSAQAFQNANAAYAEASKAVAAATNELNVNYIPYIGARNMTHDSIEKMIALIDSGEAVSISDAASKISG